MPPHSVLFYSNHIASFTNNVASKTALTFPTIELNSLGTMCIASTFTSSDHVIEFFSFVYLRWLEPRSYSFTLYTNREDKDAGAGSVWQRRRPHSSRTYSWKSTRARSFEYWITWKLALCWFRFVTCTAVRELNRNVIARDYVGIENVSWNTKQSIVSLSNEYWMSNGFYYFPTNYQNIQYK